MWPKNGRNKPSPNRNDLVGTRIGRLVVLETDYAIPKKAICKCLCDCGNVTFVNRQSLVMAKTKSCGCFNLELCIDRIKKVVKERDDDALLKLLLNRYRSNARNRNHVFNLSFEDFRILVNQDCFYCGEMPSIEIKTNRDERIAKFNGIDRLDNDLGYENENCVPCCTNCNYRKHTLSFDDFISWIRKTYLHLKQEEII